jgi:hypothetical protein
LLSGAALAALALTASACTSSGSAGGTQAVTDTAARTPSTAVTQAQARQIFDHYVATTTAALAAGNQKAALSVINGVQRDTVSDQFIAASYDHAKLTTYRYGTPEFYLPATAAYPQWFVASVRRTASAPTTITNVPLAAQGQVLMVFDRTAAQAPWMLASSAQLPAGQALPKLAMTSDGHAEAVPLDTTTTLTRPDVTGPLQATVVDGGPASAASRAVASGPLTTGIYSYQASPSPLYAAPRGDVRQWELEGSNYGSFALRTSDGGALVCYAMYLNTVVEVPAALAESDPVNPGLPINVPPDFAPLLSSGTPAPPRISLTTQLALAFVAIDPSATATNPKIQVIGIGGGPNWANES